MRTQYWYTKCVFYYSWKCRKRRNHDANDMHRVASAVTLLQGGGSLRK